MRIVSIVPGSGGTFYCQNCMRDNALVKAMKRAGHDVSMVPMYLPLNVDVEGMMGDTPVFYGAVNLYLKEKLPMFRKVPSWLEHFFDSERLLQYAARKSGSTRAAGMEEMTLSMLYGEDGRQAEELEHLIRYLDEHIKPQVVHLSNALLMGLAPRLKRDLGAAVVCSLEDENEWVDPMAPHYQAKVWAAMAEKAGSIDAFVPVSRYFGDYMQKKMNIPDDKLHLIYPGFDLSGYRMFDPPDKPVIGYLARMYPTFGLDVLVDAYLRIKKISELAHAELHITGGYTADDKPFVHSIKQKLQQAGVADDVRFVKKFNKEYRIEFLRNLSVLSVPVKSGQAFGAFQAEALAAGVPLVQPKVGGFPEVIELTGGGVIYEPNDADHLAEALRSVLTQPEMLQEMREKGHKATHEHFNIEAVATKMLELYRHVVG